MPRFKTLKINNDFRIEVNSFSHPTAYSKEVQKEIESIWTKEKEEKKDLLFNGKLLSLIQYNGSKLVGEFIEYKIFLAQLRNQSLKEELEITPVCVTGVILCNQHILIGKRALFVTQSPGFWECPPSGGIDDVFFQNGMIDIKKQILDEMQDEVTLSPSSVENTRIFALIHDIERNVIDIAAEIILDKQSFSKIPFSSKEYSELKWVPLSEIKSFAADHQDNFVPLSLHLLSLLKFI